MKRFWMVAVTGVLAIALAGCSSPSQTTGSSEEAPEEEPREQVTVKESTDPHTWYVKDYVGMNAASVGYTALDGSRRDAYGAGTLRIIFKTGDGTYIDFNDEENGDEALRDWKVVGQDLAPNSEITYTFMLDENGEEYDNLVNCQTYEEIVLAVAPVSDMFASAPDMTEIESSPDKYTRYVKDYVGRNLASCGYYSLGGTYNDHYGAGYIKFDIVTDDGSYVDPEDTAALAQYQVTSQSVEPNTPITMTFTTDPEGKEYDNLVSTQSIESITLNVTRIAE